MTLGNWSFCAGFAVLASACATEHLDSSSDPLVIQSCPLGGTNDGFTLGQLSVQGSELVVPVEVGGGCAQHSFAICWDGMVLDTYPGQIDLALSHDGHGDRCDALLFRTLHVDVSSLPLTHPPMTIRVTGATAQDPGTSGAVTIQP